MHARVTYVAVACAAILSACAGGTTAEDATGSDAGIAEEPAAITGDGTTASPAVERITRLAPVLTFPVADAEAASGLTLSSDGSRMALHVQPGVGGPSTIRVYDTGTGALVVEATFDYGFADLAWDDAGRLAAADSVNTVWRSWDGETLAELPTAPYDFDCDLGRIDPATGFRYSWTGTDALCRVDPTTGQITSTAPGAITAPETRFWVRSERGEIVVEHWPGDEPELLSLDAATLQPTGSATFGPAVLVLSVGATMWVDDRQSQTLEPGGLPAPDANDVPDVSDYGRYFFTANGTDDIVLYDAVDGSVVGALAAGFNPSTYAGWSVDDALLARLTLDGQVEIYDLGR